MPVVEMKADGAYYADDTAEAADRELGAVACAEHPSGMSLLHARVSQVTEACSSPSFS